MSQARITIVETLYHQSADGQPTSAGNRFSRMLKTDEQPFIRRFTVTEEWKSLECGWLAAAGQLLLVNEEGTALQVVPTEEERAAIAARVVEIGGKIDHDPDLFVEDWLIHPGESFRGHPARAKELWLRCRAGKARCSLYLYPE